MFDMMLKAMGFDMAEIMPKIEEGRKLAIDKVHEFEARLSDLEQSALSMHSKLDKLLDFADPKDVKTEPDILPLFDNAEIGENGRPE